MDSESQDATTVTFALADSRIYSFMKMMTLYMRIVAKAIFLSVSFLCFQCCDNVDIKVHWCLQNQSIVGRKILLNTLSPSRTTTMSL